MTRALRPPRPVRVRLEEGRPAWLEAGPRLGFLPRRARVERGAGPFEVSGGWWGERPFRRLYFDLELEGNLVVRVFLDRLGGRWWMDGIVD